MALTKVSRGLLNTSIVDNGNATAITIDSSQNVLVNRTSVFTTAKMEIQSDSGDASTLALNTIDTDGSILEFYKAGTAVGSIGVDSSDNMYFESSASSHTGLTFPDNAIVPRKNGSNNDAGVDLGASSVRFKDLYLSGDIAHKDAADNARLLYDKSSNLLGNAGTNLYGAGIYLGGTGSVNYLDEYEEGTWIPSIRRQDGTINATATILYASFVKIGRLVTAKAYFHTLSNGSSNGSSYWRINGLPFTGARYSGVQLAYNTTSAVGCYIGDAGGNIILVGSTAQPYSGVLSGNFMLNLTYETDS